MTTAGANAEPTRIEPTRTEPTRLGPPRSGPTPVVLDVDTGVDDACAVLLAARHPALELRAVSCVAGNADVDQVVANTLRVLELAGRTDVPVARGAERPLLEPARPARHVHGDDGMGDLGFGASDRRPDPRHAIEMLRDVLREAARRQSPVTLIPLAPLTNVALLLRTYPDAARGLARIVFMGGAARGGNATAAAEFNVWHDPEAAAITLEAAAELGVPVTMYGLDVFYDVRVTSEEAAELIDLDDPAASLAGRLIDYQCQRFDEATATIGDAGAVCAVIDPEGLGVQRLPIRVELGGSWTRGQTIVDTRTWAGDSDHDPHGVAPTLVDVALTVNSDVYKRLWLDAVSGVTASSQRS